MSEKVSKQPLSAEDRQFRKNKWFFSVSGIGRDLSYQLVATFLLTYIQFGVALTTVQFTVLYILIAVGGKVWDAINDPMMGAIIEGTHMKWGKFKPWIIVGAVSCGAVILAMFNIRPLGWGFVVYMTIIYLLWESTFTINDISYWSMLASLSSETKKRNSVTMLTVLFAGVGAIIAQGVIPMVTTGNMVQGYSLVALVVAVVFIGSQLMCGLLVKERPRVLQEKAEKISLKKMWKTIKSNDQVLWMTLSMLFYNIGSALLIALASNFLYLEAGYDGTLYTYVVICYGLPNVLANALYTKLAAWLGRKKLQRIAIIVASVGYGVVALMGWSSIFPFSIIVVCICVAFIAVGQSLFYMASIVNMTNCVEYNEYKNGERNEAVISTLRPFMAKFADALKYGIIIVVLVISGVYGMSQSVSALETQKSMFAKFTTEQAAYYTSKIQQYDAMLQGVEVGSEQYTQLISQINEELLNDEIMKNTMLDASQITAVAKAEISNGTQSVVITDIEASYFVEGTTYTLEITDAANAAFRDAAKGNLAARLSLRMSITALPILMLVAGLIIQRKKFFIDEQYYDNMLQELEARHESAVQQQASDSVDTATTSTDAQ